MIHKTWDLTIQTTHETYPGTWNPPTSNNNSGFTVDGELLKIRNHNVEDSGKRRFRYMALTIKVNKARTREFDAKGDEIDSQYQTEVLDRKGYLNVYSHVKQDDPFEVSVSELKNKTNASGNGDEVEFWAVATLVKPAEFQQNERVRLKTLGNSKMIETITSQSSEKHGNYYGEDVLNRWDGKIQDYKTKDEHEDPTPTTDVPVDDDEWD